MNYLLNFIPKRLLISLCVILFIIWGLNYGLIFLNSRIIEQTKEIQKNQTLAIEDIKNKIQNENSYRDFVHFFALKTLFEQKKSITNKVDEISQILPKALRVNSLYLSNVDKSFVVNGQVNSAEESFRVAKYFDELKDVSGIKREQSFGVNNSVFINISGKFVK
ncbi:MAG: hypothetical protein AAB371_00850 [Patescibacteria group bacterium]